MTPAARPVTITIAAGRARPGAAQGSAAPANGTSPAQAEPAAPLAARAALTPSIDIHEEPEGLVLEADIPGASEETVTVELDHNVLSLCARVAWPVPADARLLYGESAGGNYSRSFILSEEVERSQITAALRNGVLRLWLPRADRVKTRRIEVKSLE